MAHYRADIYVKVTVCVYIGHGHSAAPVRTPGNSSGCCGIPELEITLVDIEFVVAAAVGRKIKVWQTIVIDITGRYPATIVIIEVIQDVE